MNVAGEDGSPGALQLSWFLIILLKAFKSGTRQLNRCHTHEYFTVATTANSIMGRNRETRSHPLVSSGPSLVRP